MIYEMPTALILVVSDDHKIVRASMGWKMLLDFTKEELEGEVFTKFVHPDDLTTTMSKANEVHTGLVETNFENRFLCKNGSYINLSWSASVDGEIGNRYGCAKDITKHKKNEEKLSYQASHDALTGLINRSDFEQRTNRLLATIQTDKAEHAMCFLDLDRFKIINDTCGHVAGDEVLRQAGMLFRDTVRKRDTLARLGGDEFGVLRGWSTVHWIKSRLRTNYPFLLYRIASQLSGERSGDFDSRRDISGGA
jgi:PAS domain S-box-containing protein